MNHDLINQVLAKFRERPARLFMNDGIVTKPPGSTYKHGDETTQVPECGTVCCFAGMTCLICEVPLERAITDEDHYSWKDIREEAQSHLCLTRDESERLFYLSGWPPNFRDDYLISFTAVKKLQVLEARVKFFQETDGTDHA